MQFYSKIRKALGEDTPSEVTASVHGAGALPSFFDVSGLAVDTVTIAAEEVAALQGAASCRVDVGLALRWFDMTLRGTGWEVPSSWDPIAGDYKTKSGWIRLHTNVPRHRAVALSILGCAADRGSVAEAVERCEGDYLEQAVVEAGGCAAVMRTPDEWHVHPQGIAVSSQPLIHWSTRDQRAETNNASAESRPPRILDLTRVLAGPVATRFLAAFGMDVLRIDPPDWDEPGLIPEVTIGKRCVYLDLKTSGGRAAFDALLKDADVLVHGLRPGALERLGYHPNHLRSINPTLMDVAVSAYGTAGPWSGRRGFDSLVQMSCGIALQGMVAYGRDRPTPLPVQALDHATGYLMAAAVARALRVRRDTGAVKSARLSLARTADLLMQGQVGTTTFANDVRLCHGEPRTLEVTHWGQATRVAFPASIDAKDARWRYPAGPLGASPAIW